MKLIKRAWNWLEGIHGLLLVLYVTFIFFTYYLVTVQGADHLIKWGILVFGLALGICPGVLRGIRKVTGGTLGVDRPLVPLKWKLVFLLVPLGLLLFKYIVYYPGSFSYDSMEQYGQALSGQYSDWHPVIHTLLAFKVPLLLTGGWYGSIVLFQVLAFSGAISYTLFTVWRAAGLRYAVATMIFFLVHPGMASLAMYPWKDTAFTIGALLLASFSLRIWLSGGEWLKKPVGFIAFAVVAAVTTLVRHNGILFTGPLCFAVCLLADWKRALALCISVLALVCGIRFPLYSALNVEARGSRLSETMGLPMTVIGAVAKYAPEQLDEETREFVDRIGDQDVWEKYEYGNYNPVKRDERADLSVIEEYGAGRVIGMALRCFRNAPRAALTGLIRLTDVSYSVCDDYRYFIMPGNAVEGQGIARLRDLWDTVCSRLYIVFPWGFMYIGAMHLILIVVVLAKCRFRKWEDWKRIFLVLPVFVYNWGTTLLLTGAPDSARFLFYTFMVVPVVLVPVLGISVKRRNGVTG